MNRSGLNQGTSGNISLRWRDGLLITPTSLPYDQMTPDDIVFLGMDGRTEGHNQPSSEWRFHRDIMKAKPDVAAIVHAHPIYSTIIAIMGLEPRTGRCPFALRRNSAVSRRVSSAAICGIVRKCPDPVGHSIFVLGS